jgi:hypothetical protein
MRFEGLVKYVLTAILSFGSGIVSAHAEETAFPVNKTDAAAEGHARPGVFIIGGDAGYYTYGMQDVNNHFRDGKHSSINGGLGYGAALKLVITRYMVGKVGMDYLFTGTTSSRVVGGTAVDTEVNLPATMAFIGGEYVLRGMKALDFKIIAGYTLVTIFHGQERDAGGDSRQLGTISGSGSGAQIGGGIELYTGRRMSLETSLAYNFAKVYGATFAGSEADPAATTRSVTVDYSGLVAKVALNIYLIP